MHWNENDKSNNNEIKFCLIKAGQILIKIACDHRPEDDLKPKDNSSASVCGVLLFNFFISPSVKVCGQWT